MENKNSKLDTLLKISIILSILLFSSSVSYYLLVHKPGIDSKEKEEIKNCLPESIKTTEEINGDRDDANYFFKKCLRERGLIKS